MNHVHRINVSEQWRPSACGSELEATEANLRWPTHLAINYVNNAIGKKKYATMKLKNSLPHLYHLEIKLVEDEKV